MLKPDTSVNTQPYKKETEFYYKKQIVKYKNYDKNSPEDLNGYLKENEDHTYLKRKGKYCRVSYLNHFRTNRSVTFKKFCDNCHFHLHNIQRLTPHSLPRLPPSQNLRSIRKCNYYQ